MAREFTNSTNQIETDMNSSVATDRTYAAWLYRQSAGGSSSGRWFHKGGSNAIEHAATQSSGKMQFRRRFNSNVGVWEADTAQTDDTWVHCLIFMDNSSASNNPSIYWDGSADTVTETTTPVGTAQGNTETLTIGNNQALGTRGWDGYIAHHAVWDFEHRQDEIDFLAAGGDPRYLPAGLISYHALDEDLLDTHDANGSGDSGAASTTKVDDPVEYIPFNCGGYLPMPDTSNPVTVSGAVASTIVDTVAGTITTSADVQVTGAVASVIVDTVAGTTTATVDAMTVGFFVDWDDNNNFTGTYDEITADVIRARWRIGFHDPYQLVADDINIDIELVNTSGKYNPENSSSVLFGNLLPHRRAQVVMDDGGSGVVMWTGWIEVPSTPWKPAGANTGKITARMIGGGPKRQLDSISVDLPLYTDTTADVPLLEILTQVIFPPAVGLEGWSIGQPGLSEIDSTTYLATASDFSTLDTGVLQIPTYGDIVADTAYEAIGELMAAERGRFFIDRDGKAVFYNRHHFLTDTTNDATIDTSTGNFKPTALEYVYGSLVKNKIKVTANPRQTGTSETLAELDSTVTIPGNDSREWEQRLRDTKGRFVGSGALIASPTFSQGSATVSATARGGIAKIGAVNTSATDAVMTALTITGAPVVQQNNISVEESDATSITAYGVQALDIDLGPLGTHGDAESIGQFELQRRKDARGEVLSVEYFRLADGNDNAFAVNRTVGDRVRIIINELGHDQAYFIIGEEHEWQQAGQSAGTGYGTMNSRYYLEPAALGTSSGSFWLLGSSGFSEINTTTYIGL